MHHTPGPWTVSTRQGRTIVLDADRNEVCEAHAAAALIAAAPELLDSLRRLMRHIPADFVFTFGGASFSDDWHKAQSAISKAIGV